MAFQALQASDILDHFLNCTSLLLIIAMLKQLLYHIVAVGVPGPQNVKELMMQIIL